MSRFIIAIISILVLSCVKRERSIPDNFDSHKTSAEIREMLDAYHSDMTREGLMAEFKYLDSTDTFFWVPPGYQSALDYDSVRAILEANARAYRSVVFSWDTLQIFPLSNTIATYSGIVNGEMTDTTEQKIRVSIIESGTIIKRADGWKLLCGQSAVLPE
jgi:hypothetical protein